MLYKVTKYYEGYVDHFVEANNEDQAVKEAIHLPFDIAEMIDDTVRDWSLTRIEIELIKANPYTPKVKGEGP